MIYIEKLELKNFQSHAYTEIDFDRGLNVILGNSDSGKTAIIRAIKWVLYNEPRGDYFIRQGEREVSVKITLSTGAIIQRYRTPSKNGYFIVKPDGEEQRFESFGSNIPKEVTDLTRIYPVSFEKNKNSILNIASQLEGPFLLDESSSTRASAIGRLIGVNYIDDALRNVRKDSLKINSELADLENRKDSLEEDLSKFDYLESYKKIYKTIVSYREKIEILQNKKNLFENYRDNLDNLNKKIYDTSEKIKTYGDVEELDHMIVNMDKKVFIFNKLNSLSIKNKFTDEEIETVSKKLDSLKNIEGFKNLIIEINSKVEILRRYQLYKQKYSSLTYELDKLISENESYKNLDDVSKILILVKQNIDKFNKLFEYNSKYISIYKSLNIGNDYYEKNFKFIEDLNRIVEHELVASVRKLINIAKINLKLKNINSEIKLTEDEIQKNEKSIKTISEKYENIIIKGNVCPFCFSEINEESLEHIKYHLRND